ncbi:MAG: ChbG/HpnK family deacetylase [Spirochaetales bacterium]|nr:ChbG/HpnK family deacetylase [Spirochaetales bacterium]
MHKKIIQLSGFICLFLFFLALFTGCVKKSAQHESTGVPAGEVVLIVNGDDVGITPVYTDSTLDAYFAGKISSASIVPGGHDAGRAISILKEHPGFEIGIHLSLTGDWKPLTPGETAPSLYSKDGTMWHTQQEVQQNVKPEHAKIEWEAQIKKIKDEGIKISHLDSHMGCYFLSPELFTAAFELSRQYEIPLIAVFQKGRMPAEWEKYLPVTSYTGIYTVPGGKNESLENRTEAYWEMFQHLTPGIHYIFTHQGILPEGQQPFGDIDIRINEYKFWTSEETSLRFKKMGFEIKTFSALRKVP